eukprot:12891095-Prorocentrum_lima.AAC.1
MHAKEVAHHNILGDRVLRAGLLILGPGQTPCCSLVHVLMALQAVELSRRVAPVKNGANLLRKLVWV